MIWRYVIFVVFVNSLSLRALATPVALSVNAQVIANIKLKCDDFAKSCDQLRDNISQIKQGNPASIRDARVALLSCRRNYKAIEFFLEYYFKSSAHDFNSAPRFEAEEPEDDYLAPVGLQQMEALLFNADVVAQKNDLLGLAINMSRSAYKLPLLFVGFHTGDAQLLRSLQVELVRIMTLGITGYDAPLLKSGITEAYYALVAIQIALQPFIKQRPSPAMSRLLSETLLYLKTHPDFDKFNRMQFLTSYAMPLQQQLVLYCRQSKLNLKETGFFNAQAKNIFSPDALNADVFLDFPANKKQLVTLGKQLFFDKRLSGPATRNCATCHQPDRYFTDGLAQSLPLNVEAKMRRNAPTLMYAGFQHTQFWDSRAMSLVEQVREVLNNKQEMAATDSAILARLAHDKKYISLFKDAFPAGIYQQISMYGIAEGLAAYVLTLSPRNSRFDKYMAGDKLALTKSQIKG